MLRPVPLAAPILALVVSFSIPVVVSSQPLGSDHAAPADITRERIAQEYLRLHTELRSREFLARFEGRLSESSTSFVEKVYGVRLDPMLAARSDREINVRLRELDISISTEGLTYGGENVTDIFLNPPAVPDPNHPFLDADDPALDVAGSVVAIVRRESLTFDGGKWTLTMGVLEDIPMTNTPICQTDRYFGSPITEMAGTGFLVGPDLIATAGHVVSNLGDNPLDKVYFLFDYVMESPGVPRTIYSPSDVYVGADVKAERHDAFSDWAIIRLTQPVVDRTPLNLRPAGKVPSDASVYMLGHPYGMPIKYTGPSAILENTPCSLFLTDLDAHKLNSGSPIFNAADHVVEGILVDNVADFQRYCLCVLSAVHSAAMGTPGARATRILEVVEYLSRPDQVVVNCLVPAAEVLVGGTSFDLTEGEFREVPYLATGLRLFLNTSCTVRYYPYRGQTWAVRVNPGGSEVIMERVCPE